MSMALPQLQLPDDYEQEVVAHLRAHPEFFERHPALLEELRLPHPSGPAVSLVERQVQALRRQNGEYRERIAGQIRVAQENEQVHLRLHRLTLSLLESLPEAADLAEWRRRLQEHFIADAVELRLFPDGDPGELRELLADPSPRCGRLGERQMAQVFGTVAPTLRSCCLVPFAGGGFSGLLAFGSRDEQRFSPSLGTDFLHRLAELVAKALEMAPLPVSP